jgi:hypothetical protein
MFPLVSIVSITIVGLASKLMPYGTIYPKSRCSVPIFLKEPIYFPSPKDISKTSNILRLTIQKKDKRAKTFTK